MKKMVKDQYINMDDKKWADILEDRWLYLQQVLY